jgi:MFS family permease
MTMQSRRALKFIVLLGVVSLFADVTYEGARSAAGPFLALLGASALTVSLVSGGGELVGYTLRLWSGRLADRTQHYWAITFVGYAINLLAVPLLALAGNWPIAAGLLVLERTGKALRTPARDAMLSYATKSTGRGWGFGLHEALDQIGATIGPLIVAAVVLQRSDYRQGFAVLLLPAVAALSTLGIAWRLYPDPRELEPTELDVSTHGFPRAYWIYLTGSCLVAAGYADYPLLAYHFGRVGTVPAGWIPALYGLAMAVDAVSALCLGRWFDRIGVRALAVSTLLSAGFAPLAFSGRPAFAVMGTVLWGIGMGAQESIMRAAIADMTPRMRRATAYGVFNLAYGLAWFAGSAVMGWLYTSTLPGLVLFSVLLQLAAVPSFLITPRAVPAAAPGPPRQ